MPVCGVRKLVAGAMLAGGAAGVLGAGVAHADDGTEEINGWTVTPTGDAGSGPLETTPATLSDPSDSLGLGKDPIVGDWSSASASHLSSVGTNELFATALSGDATTQNLDINDNWFPGLEVASVQANDNDVMSFLVPADGGHQVVDLFNFETPDAAPLFNPDATGPIDIGGVELASPEAGALLNNLSGALFEGNTTDWSHAMTLLDDWLGVGSSTGGSAAADAVDSSTGATSPDGLLVTAIANLTDANKVLDAVTGADVTQPVSFNTDALQFLDQLQTAEDTITAHTGSLTSLVDQLFLVPLDQGWVDASDAALQGAQELAATSATGLDIGLEVPSLQLMGDFLASLPIIGTADFF